MTCPAGVKGREAGLNQFFLRLHGLWEGVVRLPRPPPPPFDIENLQRIEPPWRAIKEWIPDDEPHLDWFNCSRNPSNPDPDGFDQRQTWKPAEIHLDQRQTWKPAEIHLEDGRFLVFD